MGWKPTLAALDVLDQARAKAGTTNRRQAHWDQLAVTAPELVTTMRRYLAQLGMSLRPGSVALIDTSLRHLADYLSEHHDQVSSTTEVTGYR